jgi:hypothetical protein
LAFISVYENWLVKNGRSWKAFAKSDLRPMAKIAGDLKYVAAVAYIKGSLEPLMLGYDKRKQDMKNTYRLEPHLTVFLWFEDAKKMYQQAEDIDGIKRVDDTTAFYKIKLEQVIRESIDSKGRFFSDELNNILVYWRRDKNGWN